MALVATILLLSQCDCFNVHFGLPKSITKTRVGHNGSYVDLSGSATISLDAETLAQLRLHEHQQGQPLQVMIDASEIPLKPNGQLDLDPQRIREILLKTQRKMPMPSTSSI